MKRAVVDPNKLEAAWSRQYERIANRFGGLIPPGKGTIVEVGCGAGQLTVPLARIESDRGFVAVDRFEGHYHKSLNKLISALARARLQTRVLVVVADGLRWLSSRPSERYGAVLSSELLPELDSQETNKLMSECHRVLTPGGVAIHSFLSPIPLNARQKLAIEADSDPRWTSHPPKEWFSPPPRMMLAQLRSAGFREARELTMKTNLVLREGAARNQLGIWGVKGAFWDAHKERLTEDGLEIPEWVLVAGRKG